VANGGETGHHRKLAAAFAQGRLFRAKLRAGIGVVRPGGLSKRAENGL
jgi:hypothetical protein